MKKKVIKDPITLVKGIDAAKSKARADSLTRVLSVAVKLGTAQGVVLHEDADDYEPAHGKIEKQIRDAYSKVGCPVIAAVPAWEMEAWWLLFPDAVSAVRTSWRKPDRHIGKNVGKIKNAKEELVKSVRPVRYRAGKFREYEEGDSPFIAEKILELGLIDKPQAKSASWDSFVAQVRSI